MEWVDYWNPIFNVIAGVELAAEWSCLQGFCNLSNSNFCPMLRYIPQPLNP